MKTGIRDEYQKIKLLGVLSLLLLLSSCMEDILDKGKYEIKDKMVDTYFTLPVPMSQSIDDPEKDIETIDVLVFKFDSGDNELYAYSTEAKDMTWILSEDPENVNDSIRFKTSLLIDEDPSARYRLVFLANAKDAINKSGGFTTGIVKSAILNKIVSENPGTWNSSPSSITPIPMWAETREKVKIEEGLKISGLSFLRNAARVDVNVKETIQSSFEMTDVYVYKPYTNGRVTPVADLVDYTPKITVTGTSLPSNPLRASKVHYDDTWITEGKLIERAIYLFESPAALDDTLATSLVIGGLYNGMTDTTYYRVDFKTTDNYNNRQYRDILRNHQYYMNITQVLEPGYMTSDSAYYFRESRMVVDITTWNEERNNVEIPGSYYLNLTTSSITATNNGYSGTIGVESNFSGGWQLQGALQGSWYTITKEDNYNIRVEITAGATSQSTEFYVVAGNLTKKINLSRN